MYTGEMIVSSLIVQYDSTVIVLYSRDHKGMGVAHPKTILTFPNDDVAVLVKPKQAFRLTQHVSNKLLWNLKKIFNRISTLLLCVCVCMHMCMWCSEW